MYMLGFTRGFPYLGGLDRRIAVPRLGLLDAYSTGGVGIASKQTGIYPVDSPGGWRLIGRTPLVLFDAAAEPVLLKPGDYLRFCSVSAAEYGEIWRQVREGTYSLEITLRENGGDERMILCEVLRPGLWTTIQDLGRPGWQRVRYSGGGRDGCLRIQIGQPLARQRG